MEFDIRTILFFLFLNEAIILILAGFYILQSPQKKWFLNTFIVGKALQAIGLFLIVLRGAIPDPLSVVVGNSLLMLGAAVDMFSISSFDGIFRKRRMWLFIIISVLAIFLFFLFSHSYAYRSIVRGTAHFFFFGYGGLVLLMHPSRIRYCVFIGITLLLFSFMEIPHVYDISLSGFDNHNLDVRASSLTIFFMVSNFYILLASMGFLLLLKRVDEKQITNQHIIITKKNSEIISQNEELQKKKENLEETLTKLKQAEEELVRSEKMASLGVLVAGISHEINNPLNFINIGIIGAKVQCEELKEVLDNCSVSDSQRSEIFAVMDGFNAMVKNMEEGLSRSSEIVKSMRYMVYEDMNMLHWADIHECIDSALTILYHQYKERIVIDKQYSSLPKIECYVSKINQVFLNILSNAVQAIPQSGSIIIKTYHRKAEEVVCCSITNSGSYITEENRLKIFDPFFTTKTVGEGVGLGLSIVYEIITFHKGSILVNSSKEEGTEFIVELPVTFKNKSNG